MLRQGILHSAAPFLQKPFSLRGIAKKVDQVLESARADNTVSMSER